MEHSIAVQAADFQVQVDVVPVHTFLAVRVRHESLQLQRRLGVRFAADRIEQIFLELHDLAVVTRGIHIGNILADDLVIEHGCVKHPREHIDLGRCDVHAGSIDRGIQALEGLEAKSRSGEFDKLNERWFSLATLALWRVELDTMHDRQGRQFLVESKGRMARNPLDLERILSLPNLPSLPSAAVKLIDIWKSDDASLEEITATIKSDPALAVRIIKATNSPYYGLRAPVSTVERAAMLLGRNVLATMSLTFSLAEQSVSSGALGEHFRQYWRSSLLLAAATEVLTNTTNRDDKSRGFLDGLMSDIGQLALLRTIPNEYSTLLELAAKSPRRLVELEREEFGLDHAEVGSRLAQKWGLDAGLAEVVRWHHAENHELSAVSAEAIPRIRAVAVAASLETYINRNGRPEDGERLFHIGRELMGMDDATLIDLPQRIRPRVNEAFEMLELDATELPDPTTIMALANQQLAEMTLRAQSEAVKAVAQTRFLEEENRQLSQAKNQLESQLVVDALTGVNTRAFFQAFLDKEIKRAVRCQGAIGVIFGDIDHFKRINDTYGHAAGDEVLRHVAQTLMAGIRQNDVVARFGGEEFVIMAVAPQADGLLMLCDRLRMAVEQITIQYQEDVIRVTMSLGASLAICAQESPRIAEALLAQADAAMYEAKRSGRNQVRLRHFSNVAELLAAPTEIDALEPIPT